MATVYLATDLRHKRPVALKALHPELSQSVGPDRFRREIEVAAQLHHPNILPVFDSGSAAGQLWFTMPVVDGESLRARLQREGPLPLDEAIRLAIQTAEALHYAHQRGIVHRDVKPENLLLSGRCVFVADFGIARPASHEGVPLTETGIILGTPAYMSPEQIAGSRQLDARSDIYSLACVLYEMLAGDPPFSGKSAQAVMARHMTDDPLRLRTVRRSLSPSIERVIAQALAKIPADRFATAAQFATALAAPENSRHHGSRRIAFRALIATLLGLSLLAGWYWVAPPRGARPLWAGEKPLEAQRIAVLYFKPVGSDPELRYIADGLTKGLIDSLRLVGPLDVVPSGGVAAYRGSEAPRDSVATELGVGTLVEGSVEKVGPLFRIGVWLVQGSTGTSTQPQFLEGGRGDLLPMQQELARTVVTQLRDKPVRPGSRGDAWILVQRAEERIDLSDSLREAEQTPQARDELRAADSLLASAVQLDKRWAVPIVWRGRVAYKLSRLADADSGAGAPSHARRALDFANEALKLEPENADGFELRGTARYWMWLLEIEADSANARLLLDDARKDLEKAVAISPAQAGAWASLSHLYYQVGNIEDVATAARKSYEADPFRINANVIITRSFYAAYDSGRFEDATYWCQEGSRRFPKDYRFVSCRLWMMTTPIKLPDVPTAWLLADSTVLLAPANDRAYVTLDARLQVAAVLARSGYADSARRVAERARPTTDVDPTRDLAYLEAFVRGLLGDADEMFGLLRQYIATNPDKRAAMADTTWGWWFRDYYRDPRFQALGKPPESR